MRVPNTYFKFKQFTIHQELCAMKVCTDACILGAWFAEKISRHSKVLDIGSGTGLLMMMLAQKSNATIDGIELEPACFKQLQENIQQNEWKPRLNAFFGDIRTFLIPAKYDFIISNPPFFERDLPSFSSEDQLAKHNRGLSFDELIERIDHYLAANGSFGILLPLDRWEYFSKLCLERHFFVHEKLFVRHSESHPFSRAILNFSRHQQNQIREFEISIHETNSRDYSKEFKELLKDYYLYL